MSEFKLDKFDQIGIVVKDIEKAVKIFGGVMDFKTKLTIVEQSSTVWYKGKEVIFQMKKVMQNFGGKQFEIVELIDSNGDHLYLDFIKEGNEGLHHLGVYTKKADELIEHFKNQYKIDVIQTGKAGKVKFDYLDTKKTLGFYLELISF